MTVPALRLSSDPVTSISTDLIVLGVGSSDNGPQLLSADPAFAAIAASLSAIGATGARDELLRLPAPAGLTASIALVGVGSVAVGSAAVGPSGVGAVGVGPSAVAPEALRYAAGVAARRLRGLTNITLALPTETDADVLAVLEGAAIGAYVYNAYRFSSLASAKLPAEQIVVATSVTETLALVTRATIVGTAMNSVRDLVNAPPSDLYPETFAAAVVAAAEGLPVEVEIFGIAELEAGGFGGILGVGQGSSRGPRLVKVTYSPEQASKHLAFVGKGITFDTGGLSLKPAAGMVGMKYDMAGAATVMAVVLAAAELAVPTKLTAWLCLAENMPSSTATRPNDVLRIRGGQTVEVLNTDAEGRLVMADGLVAASEEYPDAIVDVATLTGAQRVALGDRYSAIMGDDTLVGQIIAAATREHELLWAMPLPSELRAGLASDVADIANARMGNVAAGMLIAGVFLNEFVGPKRDSAEGKIAWAHIDIAGPAQNSGTAYGFTAKGPTAVMVRTLLSLAEEISRA